MLSLLAIPSARYAVGITIVPTTDEIRTDRALASRLGRQTTLLCLVRVQLLLSLQQNSKFYNYGN